MTCGTQLKSINRAYSNIRHFNKTDYWGPSTSQGSHRKGTNERKDEWQKYENSQFIDICRTSRHSSVNIFGMRYIFPGRGKYTWSARSRSSGLANRKTPLGCRTTTDLCYN